MNTSIWKYEIAIKDDQTLTVPHRWEPLSVQVQHGKVCIWAKVNLDADKFTKKVKVWGTGHEHDENELRSMIFLGSVQLEGGGLVFHIFVEK